jgi:two-component system sensor histidine kinase TctE
MPRQGAVRWLSRDLMLRLMLPMLGIVVATGTLGGYTAHRLTDRVFDRWLLDAASSVATLVEVAHGTASIELPGAAETVLLYDEVDHTYFSVMQGDRLLAGRRGIAPQGDDSITYRSGNAFGGRIDDRAVRIARVDLPVESGQPVIVTVAETLVKRERSVQELMLVLWPMAALVVAAAGAIVFAVRRTVRPLELIAARWNEQSHASLQSIGDTDVPRELLPFATALNNLLGRIRAMLVRERQFAATAAHQLRTPLAGLQLGLARAAAAPDLTAACAVIAELSHETQRTARLVQQLLALGRLDPEARGNLDLQRSDIVALVQDVGALHLDQAIEKDLDLELAAPNHPVLVDVQPDLISEALGNLLDNAVRYTPRGGRVLVEVTMNPISVRISDSGPGIKEAERDAVFERFVRGRDASGEGSGLGLAIARDIAALHNARVEVGVSAWGGTRASFAFTAATPWRH